MGRVFAINWKQRLQVTQLWQHQIVRRGHRVADVDQRTSVADANDGSPVFRELQADGSVWAVITWALATGSNAFTQGSHRRDQDFPQGRGRGVH